MTTTTKKPRSTQAAQTEALSVRDLIAQTLSKHAGYREAIEKQNELKAQLAKVQSEFDQVNAAAQTDVSELADRILAGDELNEREQVFARRQSLAQRIEAYKAAIAKQANIVSDCRREAGEGVEAIVRPVYEARHERLFAAVAEFEAAKDALSEVQREMTLASIRNRFNFAGLNRLTALGVQLKYVSDTAEAGQ